MKKYFVIFVFCFFSRSVLSQTLGYDINFNQVFDNREYFSDFGFPQTIFGERIDASAVFIVDSLHKFSGGLSYFYENGSDITGRLPLLILNYRYSSEHLNMSFGTFARKGKVHLPEVFLNDTLNYYRPNIEGALISYQKNGFNIDAFIDWTSRVSDSNRETFLIGLDSRIHQGNLALHPSILMYHNARSYSPLDSLPLQDNGIMSMLAEWNLAQRGDDFVLKVSTGIIASYNRYRPQDFSWGRGMISNIKLRYNILGLNAVYYYGTPIDFAYGDPFYRSGNYGRVDFFVDPFKNPKVESKFAWNIHVIPGEGVHNSQQILISVAF